MPKGRAPLPPPDRLGGGGAGGRGAGALGGILGGLGGVITCLCCLSALSLIGLWAAFIPLVAYFKYAYDQDTRAFGTGSSLQNLQQILVLLAICLFTAQFVKRQINT